MHPVAPPAMKITTTIYGGPAGARRAAPSARPPPARLPADDPPRQSLFRGDTHERMFTTHHENGTEPASLLSFSDLFQESKIGEVFADRQ